MSLFEPGRIARRSVPASSFWRAVSGAATPIATIGIAVLLLLPCLSGCATRAPSAPHPNLAAVWHDYLRLPEQRAMAIAGDPRRTHWITASSAGHPSLEKAEASALAQCRKRRQELRMVAACVVYALGDEVVWDR